MAKLVKKILKMARAVETVGAHILFWQPDGFYKGFDSVELQRCQAESATYLFHHTAVAWRPGGGIFFEVFIRVAFKIVDDAASDKFHIRLGGGEADKRAPVDER